MPSYRQQKAADVTNAKWAAGGVAGVALIVALAFACQGEPPVTPGTAPVSYAPPGGSYPPGGSTPAATGDRTMAWVMAQEFVLRSLKCPSTASFGSVWKDYQDPRSCVAYCGDGSYVCTGWVDAQNGFGAMIRSTFVCILRESGDTWTCESIAIE